MHTRETIYKRTSSGKVQVWYGELEGDKYRTTSGQLNGKLNTSEWTVCTPKNVGRSNETTGEQQAALELDAMYSKKLEREYRRSIDDIDNKHYTKPMKSIKWYEDSKKRPKPGTLIAVQPKFDGMRALASKTAIRSQDGKIIPGAPHILRELQEVFATYDVELDGELYNHEYREDFEGIMSAVKREIKTKDQRAHAERVVQYHVYDVVSSANYEERYALLQEVFDTYLKDSESIFLSRTDWVKMDQDGSVVEDIQDSHLEEKYEGSMVRIASYPYENKRSNGLFKVKQFHDDEFEITNVMEGKGNWTGHAKAIEVRLKNGNLCKASVKASMPEAAEMWKNRDSMIGKLATVKYLRYSKAGMLNLPIFKSIRWDV